MVRSTTLALALKLDVMLLDLCRLYFYVLFDLVELVPVFARQQVITTKICEPKNKDDSNHITKTVGGSD